MSNIQSLTAQKPRHSNSGASRSKKSATQPAATLTPRERYLQNFIAKHKLTIPPVEVMFQDQFARGWKSVPLNKIAVFCKTENWINPKGVIGKVLDEVAGYFGDDNFLNLSAEIDPRQVEKVIKDLLEYGSLLHGVKVTSVTDVPETVSCDPHVYQTWDGRHRCCALAIIYGKTLEMPVDISEMDYIKALNACIRSNDTRDIRKLENINYQGLKDGPDAAVAYNRKDGSIKKIAEMVVAHSLKQIPEPILKAVEGVKVCEKLAGIKGITAVNYTNCVKEALRLLEKDFNLYTLDKSTVALFNLVTSTFEACWLAIDKRSNGIKASTAWNAYSSILLGRVIGRAIHYWGVNSIRPTKEVITEFADQVATVTCAFMDNQAELYARTPHGRLEPLMLDFADKKLFIMLPRTKTSIFTNNRQETFTLDDL